MSQILLSFDIEEFDVPKEQGVAFTLAEGMAVSRIGTECILNCLNEQGIRATFFCTALFAENAPDVMQRILDEGHEVACHGCDHWQPEATDIEQSKLRVEKVIGREVYGYRQPRMFPVDEREIKRMGYLYNASLNPAFIPGRYMHLNAPRTWFMSEGVMQIPASVTPWFRIPLFWLSLHHFPMSVYLALTRRILKRDGYFVTYFHPWEFTELNSHPEYKLPYLIRHHSGQILTQRLTRLIGQLKAEGHTFITFHEFTENNQK